MLPFGVVREPCDKLAGSWKFAELGAAGEVQDTLVFRGKRGGKNNKAWRLPVNVRFSWRVTYRPCYTQSRLAGEYSVSRKSSQQRRAVNWPSRQ